MSREFRPSIEAAQEEARKNPNSPTAHGLLGELLYNSRRYHEAIQAFQKAVNLLEQSLKEDSGVKIGLISYSQEQAKKVHHSLLMMYGDCYLKLNNSGEAIKQFERALEIKNDDSESWHFYAVALMTENDRKGGLKAFREATRLKPYDHTKWKNLQIAYQNLNRPEYSLINDVLRTERKLEEDIYLLIDLLIQGAEYEKAQVSINKLFEWNPNDMEATIRLGNLQLFEGRYDAAAASYQNAIDLGGNKKELWWDLARTQCISGKYDTAERTLKSLLKLEPGHQQAMVLYNLINKGTKSEKQNIGIITFKEQQFDDEESQTYNTITYYPDIPTPLGYLLHDLVHVLARGDRKRLTEDGYFKSVGLTWSAHDDSINFSTVALPSGAWEIADTEPGGYAPSFTETSNERFIQPQGTMSDLLISGDLIVLYNTTISLPQRLQYAAWYSVLRKEADEKLKNWSF